MQPLVGVRRFSRALPVVHEINLLRARLSPLLNERARLYAERKQELRARMVVDGTNGTLPQQLLRYDGARTLERLVTKHAKLVQTRDAEAEKLAALPKTEWVGDVNFRRRSLALRVQQLEVELYKKTGRAAMPHALAHALRWNEPLDDSGVFAEFEQLNLWIENDLNQNFMRSVSNAGFPLHRDVPPPLPNIQPISRDVLIELLKPQARGNPFTSILWTRRIQWMLLQEHMFSGFPAVERAMDTLIARNEVSQDSERENVAWVLKRLSNRPRLFTNLLAGVLEIVMSASIMPPRVKDHREQLAQVVLRASAAEGMDSYRTKMNSLTASDRSALREMLGETVLGWLLENVRSDDGLHMLLVRQPDSVARRYDTRTLKPVGPFALALDATNKSNGLPQNIADYQTESLLLWPLLHRVVEFTRLGDAHFSGDKSSLGSPDNANPESGLDEAFRAKRASDRDHRPSIWSRGRLFQVKHAGINGAHETSILPVRVKTTHHADVIRSHSMERVYHAMNAIGSVPWTVNLDVYMYVKKKLAREERVGKLPGLPISDQYERFLMKHDFQERLLGREEFMKRADRLRRGERDLQAGTIHPPPMNLLGNVDLESIAVRNGTRKENHNEVLRNEIDVHFSWAVSGETVLANVERVIAKQAEGADAFFFQPVNLDFRGRAYPVAKAFTITEGDLSRGLQKLGNKVPLGYRGVYWLKVHAYNLLFGGDAIYSNDDAVRYIDENIQHIVRPTHHEDIESRAFWRLAQKKPFQAYAAFKELSDAFRSGDPTRFASNIAIPQDGSCNGLQHYSALTRDETGARYVNLEWSATPNDAYAKIAKEVRAATEVLSGGPVTLSRSYANALNELTRQVNERFYGDRNRVVERLLQGKREVAQSLASTAGLNKAEARAFEARVLEYLEAKGGKAGTGTGKEDDEEALEKTQRFLDSCLQSACRRAAQNEMLDEMTVKRNAFVCSGFLSPKFVKTTVMTAVYGVTPLGAQDVLLEKIKGKIAEGEIPPMSNPMAFSVAKFLTTILLDKTKEVFHRQFSLMEYLKDNVRPLTRKGKPIEWTTPLGFKVSQDYLEKPLTRTELMEEILDPEDLFQNREKALDWTEISRQIALDSGFGAHMSHNPFERMDFLSQRVISSKMCSAFPPNFVHSLDSSHMMLTATRCYEEGIDFASVHDSFYCHAANVDRISRIMREEFVHLHHRPVVKELIAEWKAKYELDVTFPAEYSDYGKLNLNRVLDAPYFFA